jgi:choline dehydrogenase-like flavoprotein
MSWITPCDHGRATGVAYYDSNGRLQEQSAELVVVSCAAIESARLLLNSKSRLFPNGLGNRYDWVGRNLQGHAYTGAIGLFDHETYDDLGPGASIAVCDFNHGNSGFVSGGMLANEFIRPPYQFASRTVARNPSVGSGP